jgi:hypothetical protein
MRNLLALIALLFLTFGGVGAWRGWYGFEGQSAPAGKIAFRVEIDGGKVIDDIKALFSAAKAKAEGEPQPE